VTIVFEAFCGLLACIYVMNLAYPKTWEKTFTFVQNILIGLKDNEGQVSIDRRIVTIVNYQCRIRQMKI
jgi:hypothetical protein